MLHRSMIIPYSNRIYQLGIFATQHKIKSVTIAQMTARLQWQSNCGGGQWGHRGRSTATRPAAQCDAGRPMRPAAKCIPARVTGTWRRRT
jgi:hypothetical protein